MNFILAKHQNLCNRRKERLTIYTLSFKNSINHKKTSVYRTFLISMRCVKKTFITDKNLLVFFARNCVMKHKKIEIITHA